MPLINCEISLDLTSSENCAISSATGKAKFAIADTKLYVPVITLSKEDNIKLLKQLESGFKRTINWNKYQSKATNEAQNRYLYFLVDTSFDGVNRLFVSFKDENGSESYSQYYLQIVEIKDFNDMINGKNLLDQSIKII